MQSILRKHTEETTTIIPQKPNTPDSLRETFFYYQLIKIKIKVLFYNLNT